MIPNKYSPFILRAAFAGEIMCFFYVDLYTVVFLDAPWFKCVDHANRQLVRREKQLGDRMAKKANQFLFSVSSIICCSRLRMALPSSSRAVGGRPEASFRIIIIMLNLD